MSVAAPLQSWAPLSLHFDLSSVMLAVGFRSSSNAAVNSVVQLYYRENFHWYLKQQWCGEGLTCHGFDSEVSGRLFLSETVRSLPEGRCVVRTIDLVWEATASLTAECTISVADGCEVHLTPLGLAVVPPPMSLYRTPCLTDPPRHLSFWTKLSSATGGNFATPLLFPDGWGLCCLCDRNVLFLFTGVATTSSREIGALESTGPLPLGSLLQSAGLVGGTCRQALALEQQAASAGVIDRTVNVVLLVSCPRVVSPVPSSSGLLQSFAEDTSQDVLLYVAVVMRGSKGDSSAAIEYVGKLVMDRCIVTSIVHWGAQGRNEVDAEGGDVTAPALFPFVTGAAYIAVAVCRTDSSFAVIRIKTPFAERTTTPVEHTLFVDEAAPSLHMIPEMCHKVVVSVPAGSEVGGLTRRTAVIGLSMRNHLYCGEILIATGVNSFCLNSPLGTLMYATVGTRPTLNFIDLNALHQLDPMQSVDDLVLSWGAAEPRPLERGARLVASVPAAARVILQMPRGNFETCEPRHLALKRARLMMDASSFFECLAFLRRQRIDLNLLFDYNADKFLAGVPSLVAQCLELNPDLLSLLISSLEAGDVTRSKYALDFGAVQTWSKFPIVTRPDKVDSICRAIRNGILGYMLRHDKNFRGSVQLDSSSYVNPIMCTYARQRPPRLKEALSIIKAESMGVLQGINDSLSVDQAGPEGVDTLAEELQRRIDQGSGSPQPALSRGKPQALIKYLAFLVNKEELFNAALGECDFSMARAIAKQCQMDPKAYLPLLEAFESVGSEWTEADGCVGSLKAKRTCHMKFRIFVHLNDFTSAVTWGIRGISCSSYFLLEKDSTCVIATSEVDLYNDVFETIENHELHMTSIAHIRALLSGQELMYVSGTDAKRLPSSSAGYAELLRMLSAILISHGSRAVAMGQYRQALTAFLAAEPPDFGRAIVAAKNAKDWKLAIALAGRAALQSCSENRDDIPTPKELALSIIEEFEAGLEQGMSEEEDYFSSFPCSLDFSAMSVVNTAQAANAESGGEASTSTSLESEEDRSVEVALLCVEYLDGDLDRAAAILIAGRKWAQVAQMMFRFCRVDLVQQVIVCGVVIR